MAAASTHTQVSVPDINRPNSILQLNKRFILIQPNNLHNTHTTLSLYVRLNNGILDKPKDQTPATLQTPNHPIIHYSSDQEL